jgi:hypothetical protein
MTPLLSPFFTAVVPAYMQCLRQYEAVQYTTDSRRSIPLTAGHRHLP